RRSCARATWCITSSPRSRRASRTVPAATRGSSRSARAPATPPRWRTSSSSTRSPSRRPKRRPRPKRSSSRSRRRKPRATSLPPRPKRPRPRRPKKPDRRPRHVWGLSPVMSGKDTSMTIKHVFAKLPAQDSARARQFYSEHFGFEPHREVHGHLTYDIAGVELVIFPSSGKPSGDHDQFGLIVDDLEAELARLKSEGVEF